MLRRPKIFTLMKLNQAKNYIYRTGCFLILVFAFILLHKFVLFRVSIETSPRSLYYAKDTLSQRWYLTNENTGEFSHEARSTYVTTWSDTGEFSGRIQTVKSQIFMCSLDQLNYGTSLKPDCFTNSYFDFFIHSFGKI